MTGIDPGDIRERRDATEALVLEHAARLGIDAMLTPYYTVRTEEQGDPVIRLYLTAEARDADAQHDDFTGAVRTVDTRGSR